ncbi:MAG: hypothetical protein KUG69_11280 [Marinosulfonomonas sp.]|nr:hypothetical protein [Marinosulfonomonas sp.]
MLNRRTFHSGLGATMLSAGIAKPSFAKSEYYGPNVVIIRFGGGVRRQETIIPKDSFAPKLINVLAQRGVLYKDMRIEKLDGLNTSHAEGTLNILTGRYMAYRDVGQGFLADRLVPTEPTLFEYFRAHFDVPPHEVLLINGEDRPQEEFFTYGLHRHYGVGFRSEMLSLHRFKLYKNTKILADQSQTDAVHSAAQTEYDKLLAADVRATSPKQSGPISDFWRKWRAHYGDDGLRNPRGDRLLTELTIRAMAELRPRLMMVNYQDPDYVHWGNASHYTRAISIIDEGLAQIVDFADHDPFYRDNTIFVVVPDCGRDANMLVDLPYQHHFNSRSAHEIWALVFGAGIGKNRVIDAPVDQSAIAKSIAALMGFTADRAEGDILPGLA